MAVGLGMPTANIEAFKAEFEANVRAEIQPSDLADSIKYDGLIQFRELDDEFFRYSEKLGPFGHGNPQPLFRFDSVEVVRTFPIRNGHTRGILRDGSGSTFDFIAFNRIMGLHSVWNVAAVPQINEYYGEKRRQLQIMEAEPALA